MVRCDKCTICCTLLEVPFLSKLANTPCDKCDQGTGCSIWESRPVVCRNFQCLWSANPKFPEQLRPDICGVMFEPLRNKPVVLAVVDPERPNAWKKGVASQLINQYLEACTSVFVIVGDQSHCILPEGVTFQQATNFVKEGAIAMGLVG